jgi:hypothetical protein
VEGTGSRPGVRGATGRAVTDRGLFAGLHPAGLRWMRRRRIWLIFAVFAVMIAQWLFASRLAVMAMHPSSAGVARTRVDRLLVRGSEQLVLSSTWRLRGCTVRERVVFDADRAFVHPNLPEDVFGGPKVTVYLGPCLVIKPVNPPASPVGFSLVQLGSPEAAPFANMNRVVLGCMDGSDAPQVEPWSAAEWQSELTTGWPLQWLSYQFESDMSKWPERVGFKPVGGVRVIDNAEMEMRELTEYGAMGGGVCEPYPSHGMLATRVRWGSFVGELLLVCTLVASTAYAGWWTVTYQTRRRLRLGLCVTCGYDVKGESGVCPECGRPARVHRRFGALEHEVSGVRP